VGGCAQPRREGRRFARVDAHADVEEVVHLNLVVGIVFVPLKLRRRWRLVDLPASGVALAVDEDTGLAGVGQLVRLTMLSCR
jgi:hypothetical protein